jgi:hypothetical protein
MFWCVAGAIFVANALFLVWYKWRGFMTYDRYWMGMMLVAAPFAWTIAVYFLLDYVHGLPSSGAELVHGRVFMRQKGRDNWGMEHAELTIKIDDTKDMVKANLIANSSEQIPEEVSFYYSGDPTKEVRLREETNPLWAALGLLLIPLLTAIWLARLDRKQRRGAPGPPLANR